MRSSFLALVALLALVAFVADATELDDALAQLQAGDAAAVVASLEKLSRKEPRNPRIWRALGQAHHRLHDESSAIKALHRALEIEPDSPQAWYALGAAYAAKREPDRAFEWLERARSSRRYDMTQITVDEDFAALRSDPRYAALLPKPEDFAHPFVEPVRIIREWRGEGANDQFGWIARDIGDVDGDSVNDVVTSAPTHRVQDAEAGRVYVYSTRSGTLLWYADGAPGDQLGSGVEAAGDTNADGIPDIVASGPAGKGVAHIYSGRDGRVLHTFTSNNAAEVFGNHVSGVGDFNGDGCADVIVGSPGKDSDASARGHAYVFSGKDGRLLHTLEGERGGDRFGSAVTGYADGARRVLVVGAPGAGPRRHGRVYVYEGQVARAKFTIESDDTGQALGLMFVSVPGDLDGDRVSDIYASDWSNAARGRSTGRVYIHSGRTGKRLLTLTGETEGEGFGTSPAVAGDVDGDGRADLIVGAWQHASGAISGGRVSLYSGRTGRLLSKYTSRIPGDTLGFDAVGIADVDGDSMVDLLITSGWSGVSGHHSGRVFIVSSGVQRAQEARSGIRIPCHSLQRLVRTY
jgi:hypothetical protein